MPGQVKIELTVESFQETIADVSSKVGYSFAAQYLRHYAGILENKANIKVNGSPDFQLGAGMAFAEVAKGLKEAADELEKRAE